MSDDKVVSGSKIMDSPLGSAQFVNNLIDVVNAYKGGDLDVPSNGSGLGAPIVKIKNLTGANLALGETCYLGNYLLTPMDKHGLWFEGNAVGTTFQTRFALAAEPIPQNQIGQVYVSGVGIASYSTGTPAVGQIWGPKPSTTKVFSGFPGCEILGIDTTNKLLAVRLLPITQTFCQANATIGPNAVITGNKYTIRGVTLGSESDLGFTTVPDFNNLGGGMASGDKFVLNLASAGWYRPAGSGGSPRIFKCLLNGALASASSSATIDNVTSIVSGVTAPSPTSAANYLGWAGNDNDPCLIIEDTSSGSATYILQAVKFDVVTQVTDSLIDAANMKLQKKTTAMIGKANAAQSAATDIDAGQAC